jgi:hypothetical protein
VALGDIVAAIEHEHRRGDIDEADDLVDGAVEAGLAALGLPRGPIQRPVELVPRALGRNGIKLPDCRLVISATYLRVLRNLYRSYDPALHTWIHESLHARQQYARDFLEEFGPWEGYEEGLADGLADLICGSVGMDTGETDYVSYVRAYEALALVLEVSPWALWGALWAFPVGRVRAGLVEVVDARWRERTGQPLSSERAVELLAVADQLFATGRAQDNMPNSALEARWRTVLK